MTPAEMAGILRALHLGPVEAARRLGIAYQTVWKYQTGKVEIPGPVAQSLRGWVRIAQLEGKAAHVAD